MGFIESLEDLLMPRGTRLLVDVAKAVFDGGGDDAALFPQQRANQILHDGNGVRDAEANDGSSDADGPPSVPGGPAGLQQGGEQY